MNKGKLYGLIKTLGGGSAGGGTSGCGFKAGTLYFENEQLISSGAGILLEHNAGFVPKTLVWYVRDSTSKSAGALTGAYKASFCAITDEIVIQTAAMSSSTTTTANLEHRMIKNTNVLSDRYKPTETSINLFAQSNAVQGSAKIPAGSTIVWMVFEQAL